MMKFSVVIPVFNVAPYLRACLDSVLAQDFGDWEAICVDDGSSDGSGAILDEYAKRDARFHVVHQANAGVSAARNRALELASGEFIVFLDPDDLFLDGWLSQLHTAITSDDIDLVWGEYVAFADGTKPRQSTENNRPGQIIKGEEARIAMLRHFIVNGRCYVYAVRRSRLAGIRFPIGVSLAEDVLFSVQVANCIRSLVRIPFVGYGYRQRRNSLISVGLGSVERCVWLSEFGKLKDQLQGVNCSLTIWQMVQFWLVNHAETIAVVEMRDQLEALAVQGLFIRSTLPWPARLTARMFLWCPRAVEMCRLILCASYKIFFLLRGTVVSK